MPIEETSEGWKVIGLHGDELDNSPYETEQKAKQAFNAHKMGYNGDKNEDDDSNSDDNGNSIDIDQQGENNNSGSDNSTYMSFLSNKYVIIGAGLGVAYILLKDNDSNSENVDVDQQDEQDQETEQTESTSENLDSSRKSAKDVLG